MPADYFLKIDGIPGESQDDKHKNEIELSSWGWGETNEGQQGTSSGGGSGKVHMEDFKFTMQANKASPELFLACATGKHIKEALLTCRKAGDKPQEYLKIKFSDVHVSSYQTGGGEGAVLNETIDLYFQKIQIDYSPQKKDGSLDAPVSHWYDRKESKSG